jgi:nitrogen fixation protein FixH
MTTQAASAPMTGKHVLTILASFFGVVFAVNGFFIYSALSTRPGEESGASYEAGLRYNAILAAERAQRALGWRHELSQDGAALSISLKDGSGAPVKGLILTAEIERPAARDSRPLHFKEAEDGVYAAPLQAERGSWVLSLSAQTSASASKSLYRLKQRIWVAGARP